MVRCRNANTIVIRSFLEKILIPHYSITSFICAFSFLNQLLENKGEINQST